jgi:tetratricopeptide (TPR) repeat protein
VVRARPRRRTGRRRGGRPAGHQPPRCCVALRDALAAAKVGHWAEQVDIQRAVASAWAARAEGKKDEALALLRAAADREGANEKHPVTPGPLAPARELLAEMLLAANEPAQALREFEASMRVEPNRFRGLYGAARAAELSGDRTKARTYYSELLTLGEKADTERSELREAKAFLGK